MKQVHKLQEHLFQVKVPLPFPLRWVNSYVFRREHDQSYTIMDPGLHTEEAERFWLEVMDTIGFEPSQIEKIVLTHYHPDHYGLTGWIQQLAGGVPVYMSEKTYQYTQMMWGSNSSIAQATRTLFIEHGMPVAVAEKVEQHFNEFIPLVSPQPNVSFIPLDEPFDIAGIDYELCETYGHASGHLSFWDVKTGSMFCGDHVLPQISPNISFLPDGDPDPLDSYIQSLTKIQQYPVQMAYPGHRNPFTQFSKRIDELIDHHESRLQDMLTELDERMSAYEVCIWMFGERLSTHQLRFAMSETLAHLIYLERRGKLKREQLNGCFYFQSDVV